MVEVGVATDVVIGWRLEGWPTPTIEPTAEPTKAGVVVGTVAVVAPAIPSGDPVERWRPLVCSYNWGCQGAMNVLRCESHGDPQAYSRGNIGLMQINEVHAGRVGGNANLLFNPETNVRVAHDIWAETGDWRKWGCKP